MDYTKHIDINPEVMLGKPVIKDTRLTVDLILEELSAGKSHQDLLDAYPRLTEEAIKAALAFAAETLSRAKRPILLRYELRS